MKATAVAHPIQGLVKYHGLRNPRKRVPYHDSISVCVKALTTTTTVETCEKQAEDEIVVNHSSVTGDDRERIEIVLNRLKKLARFSGSCRICSENSLTEGKGLGFSASAFAALGYAACEALDLKLDSVSLSEIVRLGAGSSTRSLAGAFAIWYANRRGRSYAEQMETPARMDYSMIVVPIRSEVKTDEAHAEVLSSCLFRARLRSIHQLLEKMRRSIENGDTTRIGELAEEDTLNLHAITMTGRSHMVLWEPETVRIIKEIVRMREEEGVRAWYSMDTGPSVFINTYQRDAENIADRLCKMGLRNVMMSGVGSSPFLTDEHLF